MKKLLAFFILAFVAGCASRSETVIYRHIRNGNVINATIIGPEAGANFRVSSRIDGDNSSKELFNETFKPSEKVRIISINTDSLADKFVEIKFIAMGKEARWENISIEGPAKPSSPAFRCPVGKCNVVIYVVDALRADRLGCYGYNKPTSPRIDDFATHAMQFERAYASASWTRPSVAGIFTGLKPTSHGAVSRGDTLRSDWPTLAETLKNMGYQTAGFISNGNVAQELGFGRGFDEYMYIPEDPSRTDIYTSSEEMLNKILPKLEKIKKPFFAYIHVIDPHAPYTPPKKFATRFIPAGAAQTPGTMDVFKKFIWRNPPATDAQVSYLSGLYDGEVAAADEGFGKFLDWLKANRLTDNTVIIFTSDHGEEFYDHNGLGHGGTLYNELLHVPFIMKIPNSAPMINKKTVSLIDIMPTILGYLDIHDFRRSSAIDGTDIFSDHPEQIYSHERLDKVEKESLIIWPFKLIHNINETNQWGETVLEYEFYNIQEDPAEKIDASRQNPTARKTLIESLREIRLKTGRRPPPGAFPKISPELKKRLESIGY